MSRLFGRVEDVYSISNYLIDNFNKKYSIDNSIISNEELKDAPKVIFTYLSKDMIKYINECDIKLCWNKRIKETVYGNSGTGEENYIFFPTKEIKSEYKTDLIYYIGDLLNQKHCDYMNNEYDILCQYEMALPLLLEYLYLKEENKEKKFYERNLSDLRSNANIYKKIYNKQHFLPMLYSEDYLLKDTLLNLIPLSSMDATLQIIDKYKDDKNSFMKLILDLYQNVNHNREEIISELNINTYGFKRLRKEIDIRGDRNE